MIKDPTFNTVNNDVIDIDLSVTKKKKFRFNKDDNSIIEVNTSDMNITHRISEAYPKLQSLQEKATKLTEGLDMKDAGVVNDLSILAERLAEVDAEMRLLIDYIFDAPVSAAAAPDGSMYDPFDGSFRYEHIIAVMMKVMQFIIL